MEPSFFAPAERDQPEHVLRDHGILTSAGFIRDFFDAMPWIACILNVQRQLVFSNKALQDLLGIVDEAEVLGARPGETLGCIRAGEHRGGCGTAEACRYCGAGRAIVESRALMAPVEYDCRISTLQAGVPGSLDLRVKASPFAFNSRQYTILAMQDQSGEKRRRVLEKVFYHDIINSAGGLRGLIGLLPKVNDPEELKEIHANLHTISEGLLEEIIEQRELSAAEVGELEANLKTVDAKKIINDTVELIRHHEVRRLRSMISDLPETLPLVKADPALLRRILLNMLKNAFEACPRDGVVRLDTEGIVDGLLGIRVHNPGFMPREVQVQVFQRSFSTKGPGRGLGTYSMKLFAETYLKGRMVFRSDIDHQTSFSVWIPLAHDP